MRQTHRHSTESPNSAADAAAWLAAIVDDSADAILSKTLEGVITSWNSGAERLFGFSRDEALGRSITMIIPDDRLHEEADILSRLRRGERVDRFETIRRRRDGTPVHIEVTISPVRNARGEIIGASKIARDIGERLRHAEAQALLAREMQHRVKNLLSIVQGLVSLGSRRATDVRQFTDQLTARIAALAAAQALVLREGEAAAGGATLGSILAAVMAPYGDDGLVLPDCEAAVGQHAMTALALLFHELATNAVKYGGLSNPDGSLHVEIAERPETISIVWRETGGRRSQTAQAGFGTDLLQATLKGLRGTMDSHWRGDMFETILELPRDALAA